MGNNEKSKTSKSDDTISPAVPDQASVHVYPDWAAMQAYYGPRVALPPYYNSGMVHGHAPHAYMWGPPQHVMPPYGGAYAAMYPHAGVYAHPAAPVASGVPSPGIQSPALAEAVSSVMMQAQNTETPAKSSGNTDKGLMNKLKGFDGLAMSIGNGGEHVGDADQGMSQSSEMGGTSDGSNGSTGGGHKAQTKRRRNHEGTPTMGSGGKTEPASAGLLTDTDSDSSKVPLITPGPSVARKLLGAVISSSVSNAPELSRSPKMNANMGIIGQHPGASVTAESWMQNDRELKRERRKQSNRESARRSRLRKQAEAEELAVKVDSLSAENVTLKSELNRLAEKSKQLKLENTILLDKLHNAKLEKEEAISKEVDDKMVQPICTENLLSRVNSTCPVNQNHEEEDDYRKKRPSTKLHQLLNRKPRTDVVAAS